MSRIRPAWYMFKESKYVACRVPDSVVCSIRMMYLHGLLMNWWGQGQGNRSVDHINRDKHDNRKCNLRVVDQSEQNRNMDKKERAYNAMDMPDEVRQSEIPKFMYLDIKESSTTSANAKTAHQFVMKGNTKYNGIFKTYSSAEIPIREKLLEAQFMDKLVNEYYTKYKSPLTFFEKGNTYYVPKYWEKFTMQEWCDLCRERTEKIQRGEQVKSLPDLFPKTESRKYYSKMTDNEKRIHDGVPIPPAPPRRKYVRKNQPAPQTTTSSQDQGLDRFLTRQ